MEDERYWQDRALTAEQELEAVLEEWRLERVKHIDTRMALTLSQERCERQTSAHVAYRDRVAELETRLSDLYRRLLRPELGGPVMFRHAAAEAIKRILG